MRNRSSADVKIVASESSVSGREFTCSVTIVEREPGNGTNSNNTNNADIAKDGGNAKSLVFTSIGRHRRMADAKEEACKVCFCICIGDDGYGSYVLECVY